jgi:hypothetical protein
VVRTDVELMDKRMQAGFATVNERIEHVNESMGAGFAETQTKLRDYAERVEKLARRRRGPFEAHRRGEAMSETNGNGHNPQGLMLFLDVVAGDGCQFRQLVLDVVAGDGCQFRQLAAVEAWPSKRRPRLQVLPSRSWGRRLARHRDGDRRNLHFRHVGRRRHVEHGDRILAKICPGAEVTITMGP